MVYAHFPDDTLVFPLPGPANICNGISGSCSTAINQSKKPANITDDLKLPFRWAGFNPLIKDALSIFGADEWDISPDLGLLVFICVYRVEYAPFVWFWDDAILSVTRDVFKVRRVASRCVTVWCDMAEVRQMMIQPIMASYSRGQTNTTKIFDCTSRSHCCGGTIL